MSTTMIISNFVLFQLGWFACVWSAAAHRPWIGVLVTTGVVVAHVLRAPLRKAELTLVFLALTLGLVFDSLLVWRGWLRYSSGILLPNVAPYWIVALWGLFATLLNVSLRWMRGRWVIAVVFGAAGGPAAYYGGLRLGALEFGNMPAGLLALAIGWAALTPLLLSLSARFDGYAGLLEKKRS
ncbi:MAG TPA: DUF2878 domain-containing protein [Nitrospira sp.]|nr:DUF2878 domain-containing protein [Nitrospira sp.]